MSSLSFSHKVPGQKLLRGRCFYTKPYLSIITNSKALIGDDEIMDQIHLWSLLVIGAILLFFSLRTPPIKDKLCVFLLKTYFSTFFGVIVVENKLLEYPVRFLDQYFEASILFEYFLYPIVCVYFYQTSYHSRLPGIIGQCLLYAAALTGVEVLYEKYTNLIEYHRWTWMYSFITIFVLSFSVRMLMKLIHKREQSTS
ncbi:Conserved hypothetical protein [Geobacillus thermodenitrificans NG80-2]|uniref:Uncharacterized protein n=2 Tax=Geobacillus thermodenitrificans TaxID=33940 RepID=A4IPW0_GEOTN|nr:Conserved hypothetical protein [Geobacillus thermodenitrificans NG80-2]